MCERISPERSNIIESIFQDTGAGCIGEVERSDDEGSQPPLLVRLGGDGEEAQSSSTMISATI